MSKEIDIAKPVQIETTLGILIVLLSCEVCFQF